MSVHPRIRRVRVSVLSLLLVGSMPAFAAMQAKPVEWSIGKQAFSGVLVYDDEDADEKRPGLVMVPDWKGVTPAAIDQAKDVAGDDYVILVADVYGKGKLPKDDAAAEAMTETLYADLPALHARATKAVEVLKAQAGKAPLDATKIGAFGYCFGGSTVLELARTGAQLAGIVSFHGGLKTSTPAAANSIKTPLLILNGADDRMATPLIDGFQKEMDSAGADWQFVNFSDTVHCFALKAANSPPGCVYNPRSAKRAYRMMDDFFEERFGGD